jgi:hypothetical protein
VNGFINSMTLDTDPVACGAEKSSLAGPSEEVAAAVFMLVGKGVIIVTGDATQLTVHKGHISGH